MSRRTLRRLTVAALWALLLTIGAWIYRDQSQAASRNLRVHQQVGSVLAEQVAALLGSQGRVVAITACSNAGPELTTQIQTFKSTLRRLGDYELRQFEPESGTPTRFGPGAGLSAAEYVQTVARNPDADVFVSFVGQPDLDHEQEVDLKGKPKLIVETRSRQFLTRLLERHLVAVAIVLRPESESAAHRQSDSPNEGAALPFQVVTPAAPASGRKS